MKLKEFQVNSANIFPKRTSSNQKTASWKGSGKESNPKTLERAFLNLMWCSQILFQISARSVPVLISYPNLVDLSRILRFSI
jgi:hypothetical protein